ncbi:MAG: hypothetical protein LC104_16585 [Bacteroidales bacterium]|nr:hypothetical protein [Bacteroidales bacterium]
MIACVLAVCSFGMAALPLATARVDHDTIRLSDVVRVTLIVEGSAPLRVEMAETVPDVPSAEVWHVRPVGPAQMETLSDGRQRWSRSFRADPFTTGSPLRLGFTTAWVMSGTDPVRHRLTWPEVAVHVSSSLQPDTEPRPITGIEKWPPTPVPTGTSPRMLPVIVIGSMFLLGLGLVLVWRWRRKRSPTHSAQAEALAALNAWHTADRTPLECANRLRQTLRRFLERSAGIPIGTRTNEELMRAFPFPHGSEDAVETLLQILSQCDHVRFGGPTHAEWDWDILLPQVHSAIVALAEAQSDRPGVSHIS